jgi:hypothetical protein
MRRQNILQMFLFVIFFSIGAAALSVSVLCDDLLRYYRNRHLLKAAQEALDRLESLNADYDALLERLDTDPNLRDRLSHAVLGTEQQDQDTAYPRPTPEQLDAARRALTGDPNQQVPEPMVPGWLKRSSEPRRRVMLFVSGAVLILISFAWFGSADKQAG